MLHPRKPSAFRMVLYYADCVLARGPARGPGSLDQMIHPGISCWPTRDSHKPMYMASYITTAATPDRNKTRQEAVLQREGLHGPTKGGNPQSDDSMRWSRQFKKKKKLNTCIYPGTIQFSTRLVFVVIQHQFTIFTIFTIFQKIFINK